MVQLSLSSEDKLLLYCSRLSISEDTKCKIEEILSNVLDWNYIVDCSIKQGISPLFYWNLKKISNGKDVPSEVMKNLEKMYYSNLARNMLLYDELSKILTAFKKAGIDTIVLKGAFLAEEIYKNIGLRPMSDIDLLVKEEDLQKAKMELTKLMYSVTITTFPTKLHEQFQTVWSNELPLVHETKKIVIEIHWDIQPPQSPYKVDINEFWNNAKSVNIAGVETLTFTSQDLLQHLCLHVDKHVNSNSVPAKPLRNYCDIAQVTRYYKETINWNYLLQSSKDHGIEEPIFQGLSIAKKHFGAFVPEDILSELEPVKSCISFEEIFKEAMQGNSKKKNQWSEISYLMNLKKIDGTWKKTRYLFGDVFPSKEFMIYRYSIKNEKQFYMYYLIRSGTALQWGLAILKQVPHYLLKSTFGK
ncbi:MAG: nucleotidyltransferase family protein [Methanosarcina sp.]